MGNWRRRRKTEGLEKRCLLAGDLWFPADFDYATAVNHTEDGSSALFAVNRNSLRAAIEGAPIKGSLGPIEPPELRPDHHPGRISLPVPGGSIDQFQMQRQLTAADELAGGLSPTGTYVGSTDDYDVRVEFGPTSLFVQGQRSDGQSGQFLVTADADQSAYSADTSLMYRMTWAAGSLSSMVTDETSTDDADPVEINVGLEATTINAAESAACQTFEAFDSVAAPGLPFGWSSTNVNGIVWQTLDFLSDSLPNHAAVPSPPFVSDNILTSPAFTVSATNNQLSYRTSYEMATNTHGGVMEISINGGPFVDILVAGGQFVTGGYDGTLSSLGNPLNGRSAWTGQFPSFKDTIVNLPSAAIDQTVQLRWRLGTDGFFFNGGWRIDTLSLCGEAVATMDYGDAPDPTFPTLLSNNGASHVVGGPLYLGQSVDAEVDGQPDSNATGDDLAGSDDDDGVILPPVLMPGQFANVTVFSSAQAGLLNAWIDFNGDGDWADAGEQVFTNRFLFAGPNQLNFTVPPSATPTVNTFARFRVSSQPDLSYVGPANDGEVEDYAIPIAARYFEVDSLEEFADGNVGPGDLSLREAIQASNQFFGFDIITFSPSLAGNTIFTGGTSYAVTGDVAIIGLGSESLSISGNNQSRVFDVAPGTNVSINDLTITGGLTVGASNGGGGIRSLGNLELHHSIIRNNTAETGGGIFQGGGTLAVADSIIENNMTQRGDGGGIRGDNAVIRIDRSSVKNNSATSIASGQGFGGGIALRFGDLTVTDSTLDGNHADTSGGAIIANSGLQITGSTISNNTAEQDGGGIVWGSSTETAVIVNSTVSGNGADSGLGGGITVFEGQMNLSHSTVANNTSRFSGAIATVLGGPTSPVVTIRSSIVALNQPVDIDSPSGGGSIMSDGYNVVGFVQETANFNQPGDQIFVANPGIAPLADNGGPTKTHALYNTSPALNTGDPADVGGLGDVPLFDQRGEGNARVADGRIDIGSFEGFVYQPPRVQSVFVPPRSIVSSVAVFFDSLVDVTSPAAFTITNRDTNQVLDSVRYTVGTQIGPQGSTSVVTFTFGPGISVDTMINGLDSLSDGNYQLDIDRNYIRAQGSDVMMENDFTFGDEAVDRFFRLFGDRDGDRDVDGQDYGRFALTFMKSIGDSGYDSRFDSDGDRDVDGQDYGRFGQRFLKQLPF